MVAEAVHAVPWPPSHFAHARPYAPYGPLASPQPATHQPTTTHGATVFQTFHGCTPNGERALAPSPPLVRTDSFSTPTPPPDSSPPPDCLSPPLASSYLYGKTARGGGKAGQVHVVGAAERAEPLKKFVSSASEVVARSCGCDAACCAAGFAPGFSPGCGGACSYAPLSGLHLLSSMASGMSGRSTAASDLSVALHRSTSGRSGRISISA